MREIEGLKNSIATLHKCGKLRLVYYEDDINNMGEDMIALFEVNKDEIKFDKGMIDYYFLRVDLIW